MIVSHTHRFIFLKSRKTAGTSVEALLSTHCSGEDVVTSLRDVDWNRSECGRFFHKSMNHQGFKQHEKAANLKAKLPGHVWSSYFKFSIARNPWDRSVSLYFWRSKKPKRGDRAYLPRTRFYHRFVPGYDREEQIRRGFAKFIAHNRETNDDFYFHGDTLCVDYVIRFENLQEDFDEVCRRTGLPPARLPTLKSGYRAKTHYSRYYDDRTREIVSQRYRRDIEQFGYRFEEA